MYSVNYMLSRLGLCLDIRSTLTNSLFWWQTFEILKPILFLLCRLAEKVSNLVSENQVLRQQALAISPTGRALSARPKTTIIQVSFACFSVHQFNTHVRENIC